MWKAEPLGKFYVGNCKVQGNVPSATLLKVLILLLAVYRKDFT